MIQLNGETEEEIFTVHGLTVSVDDTVVTLDDLSLEHSRSYQIVVIATDQTGGCSAAHTMFTVDTTPPLEGQLITGHDFGQVRIENLQQFSINQTNL